MLPVTLRFMPRKSLNYEQGRVYDYGLEQLDKNDTSRLNQLYVNHTGKSMKEIESSMERDNFMDPEGAKAFGLIDSIIEKRDIEASTKPSDEH